MYFTAIRSLQIEKYNIRTRNSQWKEDDRCTKFTAISVAPATYKTKKVNQAPFHIFFMQGVLFS